VGDGVTRALIGTVHSPSTPTAERYMVVVEVASKFDFALYYTLCGFHY